jgi:hypothetical protein
MQRRTFIQAFATAAIALPALAGAAAPLVAVYKSAGCGCCEGWINHLKEAGFNVNAHDVASPADYREKLGMPAALGSCHTATVQGYAIEGHVPASDIKRLLREKPKARGLAVPSMPLGSPGMEGLRKDPYDVLLVQADGQFSIYRHYN